MRGILRRWHRVPILACLVLAWVASPQYETRFRTPTLAADRSAEAWSEVPPEERSLKRVDQDPDADAVVLLNERNGKILKEADETLNVLDYHIRYKILTERGKRYGTFEIPAGKYSRVSNIRARTVKPDGTAIMVSPDQIFEKVVFQVADYKETAWVFHFPAVEQGVILEVRYDRHDYSLLCAISAPTTSNRRWLPGTRPRRRGRCSRWNFETFRATGPRI